MSEDPDETLPIEQQDEKIKKGGQSAETSQSKAYPVCERTFLTFSDESTFRRAFRLRKKRQPQRSYCLITRYCLHIYVSLCSCFCPLNCGGNLFFFFQDKGQSTRTQQLLHHSATHRLSEYYVTFLLSTWSRNLIMTQKQFSGWNTNGKKEKLAKQQLNSLLVKFVLHLVCKQSMPCKLCNPRAVVLPHHLHRIHIF